MYQSYEEIKASQPLTYTAAEIIADEEQKEDNTNQPTQKNKKKKKNKNILDHDNVMLVRH